MKLRSPRARAFNYLLLALLCAAVPYLVTVLLVIITGNRSTGMSLGVIPSLLFIHLIYSLVFLKTKRWIKLVFPFLTAILCIFGLKYLLPLNLINTGFDTYGYLDIAITHFILAFITWEIMYFLLVRATAVR